jgi:hypothetical protein|tara:strand:- start:2900 stop:3418 length:519 start_codon:yes stop_codon:yes gene_type:complete
MNKIRLGSEVIVSDPCYSNEESWVNTRIDNMRPGMYDTQVGKSDQGEWGDRISSLTIVHENIQSPVWEDHGEVAVDSGQMSICDVLSYRNEEVGKTLPWMTDKGNPFVGGPNDWYSKMCDRTLTEEMWGVYDTGVVSSTGFGDGCYRLEISKMDGIVHGVRVTFIETVESCV